MPKTILAVILSLACLHVFVEALQAQTAAPTIALSRPAAKATETEQTSVDLEGTATAPRGISQVWWVNQSGHRGKATWTTGADGAIRWAAAGLTLRPGLNQITVTLVDPANHSASLHLAVHRKTTTGAQQSLEVRAGTWRNHAITYQVRNGMAVVEGDMVLGPVAAVASVASASQVSGVQPDGYGISYVSQLWPVVGGVHQVPYTISGSSDNLNTALANFNAEFAGLIQFVAWTGQANYVNITVESGGSTEGFSNVGMVGGPQMMNCGSGCGVPTWLHEMGHTVGLLHEHQRPDRASYVTLNLANADLPNVPGNFTLSSVNTETIGLFDLASVMEYAAFDFSKTGLPVIESIPPGMPLSNDVGYSLGDADAIERLYGATPTQVTITTNPPGLLITVDGTTYNAPQSFSWALSSTHTVNVPADPQLTSPSDGSTYAFGAWNDLGARSHSITITPGSGSLTAPANKPGVTLYEASFIRLQPFGYLSPAVYPSGAGTLSVSPNPTSEFDGTFFTDRTLVTLTLTPTQGSGYNFYDWYNLPFPPSDNPHQFYIQAPTTQAQAVFVSDPVTIVSGSLTGPNTWNPGLHGYVDGGFAFLPSGFDATYNGTGWAAGTTHTIDVDQTESPVTTNVFYNWNSWSDVGAISHSVTQPASGSQTITASFTPYYAFYTVPGALGGNNSPCYGGVTTTPVGTPYAANTVFDFYADGTSVTTTATANSTYPGMVFAGWTGSLSGSTNPQMTIIHDQFVPTGNFNTVATPLTIASLSPATAPANSGALDVTINGTGFTSNTTYAYWNGSYRAITYISSTQLTVHLNAGDLVNEGGQDLFVGNYTTNSENSTCGVIADTTFLVTTPVVLPLQLNPGSLTFANQVVFTASAAQTVTVTNPGNVAASVTNIKTTGSYPNSFPQTNNCGTSIAAGGTCTISVTFDPQGVGVRTAAVTLTTSAGTQSIPLSGSGVTALLGLNPASVTFPNQVVFTTSPATVVTVTNSSTVAVSVTSIKTTGSYPNSFPQTNTCGTSIKAAGGCTISVTFDPQGVGARTAAVTLTTSSGTQSIPLSGSGVTALLGLTPTSLTFPDQVVYTQSAAMPITVKNSSTVTVSVTSIKTTGTNPNSFPQTNNCGTSIAAGKSCTVNVVFAPQGTGPRSAAITLTTSSGTQTVPLSGTGVAQ